MIFCHILIILCISVQKIKDRMNREIQIDMYTLPCVNEIAAGKLLYSTESSAQCSVITERGRVKGWDGESRSGGWAVIYVYLQLNSCSCTAATNASVLLLYFN